MSLADQVQTQIVGRMGTKEGGQRFQAIALVGTVPKRQFQRTPEN